MSTFEYGMVLISIIIGLGITHILSSLSSAVHRLRHHGAPIRIEITYLAWVGFVFSWLVNFWWWEFKWSELAPQFGFTVFLFLVLYAVALFSLAVILVPHQLTIVDDTWEYFLSIRSWFYGGLLLLNAIDVADTLMKGSTWGLRPSFLVYWVALTAVAVAGLTTRRRSLHAAFGIAMFVWTNALGLFETAMLGGW